MLSRCSKFPCFSDEKRRRPIRRNTLSLNRVFLRIGLLFLRIGPRVSQDRTFPKTNAPNQTKHPEKLSMKKAFSAAGRERMWKKNRNGEAERGSETRRKQHWEKRGGERRGKNGISSRTSVLWLGGRVTGIPGCHLRKRLQHPGKRYAGSNTKENVGGQHGTERLLKT